MENKEQEKQEPPTLLGIIVGFILAFLWRRKP